jgi:hypothetical protein
MIWLDRLRGIEKDIEHTIMSLFCLSKYGSTKGNIMANWQFKMRLTLENVFDYCWQDVYSQLKDNSWENQISRMVILNSFMMNQTTTHFGAWSGLMNNESSNHCGQPGMGHCTCIWVDDWDTVDLDEPMNKKKLRRLWIANKDTLWWWSIKKGGYISKQVRIHACHETPKHCINIFETF